MITNSASEFCKKEKTTTFSIISVSGSAPDYYAGVSVSPNGKVNVDTFRPIPKTSLAVEMTDGYQTYLSPSFSVEVKKVVGLSDD